MTTLNLVHPTKSDIEYKVISFPDGQQSVTLTKEALYTKRPVVIKSRLNSFKDLELIICATQCLREAGVEIISLYIPYCLGGRSDRKFESGGINYIKSVLAPIINSQKYDRVAILDPHSDVLEACIDRFKGIDNTGLIEFASLLISGRSNQISLVSPDAGALKKIYSVAKRFKINNVVTASKVRDISTGRIIRTELPTMDLDGIEHIVIVDDICDGGRTFIELAKEIKKQTNKPIYLIVTHGIFSAGYTELKEYFSHIFCTNSIKDIQEGIVKQFDVF